MKKGDIVYIADFSNWGYYYEPEKLKGCRAEVMEDKDVGSCTMIKFLDGYYKGVDIGPYTSRLAPWPRCVMQ